MNCNMRRFFPSTFAYLCFFLLFWIGLGGPALAQTGQVDLPRIQAMPNFPSPYKMRNWKEVAVRYDELIYALGASGQFLPLIHLKPAGVNYPTLQPILLDTYVGSASAGNQAESINIIPSLVGASLMGIDKSNQNGVDWITKSKDFFNKANGQNVYLNAYSTSSGNDWWYDLMPNVFFYQLYAQYPGTSDFQTQFITIADRWLGAVQVMGGSATPWTSAQMNYRAFNFGSMTPNPNGVHEPEASGAIAWLLYNAWSKTGDKKYLDGAQQSMEFLSALNTNPSYEIQLPYGTLMAAKMNAELGTQYDIAKMLNWNFDRGSLRGWGAIVGTWNGSNVSGLIGEANDAGNDYAFVMNGFQQMGALVPLVKYDKRFARAIGKWALNVSNASRLFYSKYLPAASQDDFAWSSANDPQSVIAYEALKENKSGNHLYATGDAKAAGWAQTNLGLYGSSSVGYLAAVVDTTDVSGILLLDLNKTDFFHSNSFPSYLVYNPYGVMKSVTLPLGSQTYEVYNAISETIIKPGATGNSLVDVPANEAMVLVYLPQGSVPLASRGKLYVGNEIIDQHYGYDFAGRPRIKSMATIDTLVVFNQVVPVYVVAENAPAATYAWYVNDVFLSSSLTPAFSWTAPGVAGQYTLRLDVVTGTTTLQDSVIMQVVDRIPVPPAISGFTADKPWYYKSTTAVISCQASNQDGGVLQYIWTIPGGSIVSQNGATLNWSLPVNEGLYELSCEVKNADNLSVISKKLVLVKMQSTGTTAPYAYYSLDGHGLDVSGNGRDATVEGVQLADDPRGQPNRAYRFSSGSDIIFVNNSPGLNFQNSMTLSFWVKLDDVPQETFVLSHGSWEERWKVSVTPEKKMRLTVKTNTGTRDLDSSFPLLLNHFYHFTAVYSGYSLELYADGLLDTYMSHLGPMAVTAKAMTFGRKDVNVSNYFLRGTLDEVRIYDVALSPDEIETLKTIWSPDPVTGLTQKERDRYFVYPNPARGTLFIKDIDSGVTAVELLDVTGRKVEASWSYSGQEIQINFAGAVRGLIVLRIQTRKGTIYRKVMMD